MSFLNIRKAEDKDMDWLLSEGEKFSRFFDSKIPLYNHESLREVFAQLIATHLILVAEVSGKNVGFIAGVIVPHFFNPKIITLSEVLFWVTEEARGSRAALVLIETYIKLGKTFADWITMSVETGSLINERSLTKRGFRLKEKAYLLEVC